jgi:hypothetical protein
VIELFREAQVLQQFLVGRGWGFCFIGGVALQHWGEPRVTRDLDLTVFTGFGGETPVVCQPEVPRCQLDEPATGAPRGRSEV